MDIFFQIIVASLLTDAIIDCLFSPSSLINIYYWNPVQNALKNYVTNYIKTRDLLYKLITCPYCFSFWVSLIVSICIFDNYIWMLGFFAVWRLSNFFRLYYNKLNQEMVLSTWTNTKKVEVIEED